MPEIVAALRVKDESRWIAAVVTALSWCKATYLLDDHSQDDTRQLAANCGATVIESPFIEFDEARDKEYLVKRIARDWSQDTWVLMVDGDEVLEQDGEKKIRATIKEHYSFPAFTLRILYLWDGLDQVRVDGVYGNFTRPSIFRLGNKYRFKQTDAEGHLHCSSVPAHYVPHTKACPAVLLHFGYMYREDRMRKWRYYNSIDPKNKSEGYDPNHPERGSYPHIIQGDVPQIPASMRLKHAGPLSIEKIRNNTGGGRW